MIFDFMRVILFFDLPMVLKKDVKSYNQFRKYLIQNGYVMMQFSVYSKIFNNRESATNHISTLKRSIPLKGHIRIMLVTEKQYSNIEILVGGKSSQEKIITIDPYMKL